MKIRHRPRRNRRTEGIRKLVQETALTPSDFIQPLFVTEGKGVKQPISSMPGQFRLSLDETLKICKEVQKAGIPGIVLFPVIADKLKDKTATESLKPDGLFSRAIQEIKSAVPELMVFSDVAMDPYSSDGHDGYVNERGEIENDRTIEILCQMACVQAAAGADFVAPSDMMDGRVAAIRNALDQASFNAVGIMSYTAKYASAFYGPFREALDSSPRSGDKKTYQMNPANRREAIREAMLDATEGADILMVKPALPYLDIIAEVKRRTNLPIAAYQVSGEYAMIKAAAERGWLDGPRAMAESLLSIKRAGADIILSYAALEWAKATWRHA